MIDHPPRRESGRTYTATRLRGPGESYPFQTESMVLDFHRLRGFRPELRIVFEIPHAEKDALKAYLDKIRAEMNELTGGNLPEELHLSHHVFFGYETITLKEFSCGNVKFESDEKSIEFLNKVGSFFWPRCPITDCQVDHAFEVQVWQEGKLAWKDEGRWILEEIGTFA